MHKYTNINTQMHKYTNTNIQIKRHIQKYKCRDTNMEIESNEYKYENTNTQIYKCRLVVQISVPIYH